MKTSPEDFAVFRAEATRWLEILGLMDFDIAIQHAPLSPDACAQTDSRMYGRTAVLTLNSDYDDTYREDPRELALHEVCEVLLAPLESLAQARTWDPDTYVSERHAVINRLVNFIKRTEYWQQNQPKAEARK